jgi:hypothetical protein
MNSNRLTQDRFLSDVAQHQMTVLLDNGLYRHVRFQRPGTTCMHFDLVTYPGYLVYSGDMGNFLFERSRDMFGFFRAKRAEGDPAINPQYWSEKLEAHDRHGGFEKFDMECFKAAVKRDFDQHWEDAEDTEARDECWAEVEDKVLGAEDEWEAVTAIRDFQCGDFSFADFFEHRLNSYTRRFIWCCYALAWGIQKYDEAKAAQQPAAEAA